MILERVKQTIHPLGVGHANRPKMVVCGVFPYIRLRGFDLTTSARRFLPITSFVTTKKNPLRFAPPPPPKLFYTACTAPRPVDHGTEGVRTVKKLGPNLNSAPNLMMHREGRGFGLNCTAW